MRSDLFDEPEGRTAGILAMLDREGMRLAVINTVPEFPARMDPRVVQDLERRFPGRRIVGRFRVLWRDSTS